MEKIENIIKETITEYVLQPEGLDQKIRNKLTPIYNLIEVLKMYDKDPDPKIWAFIMKENSMVEKSIQEILELTKDYQHT